ncbi:MAG: hypothetical protein J5858_08920 [Lentisphaeria bacterium]|nr:hypothetical protein [Lentisphaeria bacterium]
MSQSESIQFEKVGGSLQPIVKTAADMEKLLELSPAFWSITSVSLDAISMDPVFLKFMDSDTNGKIRVDEVKTAVRWILGRLRNFTGLEKGSDTLILDDLNQEDGEGKDILASAVLALKNTGVTEPKEISLSGIRDRKKIIAAGLSNGDGVIPVSLLTDENLIPCAALVAKLFGTVPDASGLEGFNQEALDKFRTAAAAYLQWRDSAQKSPEILPYGEQTPAVYGAFSAVREALDYFFELCGALRMFGENNIPAAVPGNLMNTEEMDAALKKAPAAPPVVSGIFDRTADLNPLWHDRILAFFEQALPGRDSITETEWVDLKKKFSAFEIWNSGKPTGIFDGEQIEVIRTAIENDIPGKLQSLIDRDLAYAKEISGFDNVEKLILYQENLLRFLNNYVNLRILFNPSVNSILQAGILVMDGRCFKLAIRVASVPEHKKIAERSDICIMYIDAQTGNPDALKKMQLAVAVTHGDIYNLFVGKRGVFFTADGKVWDAKVTDFIQQPVSVSEAIRMPFYRFGAFLGKQMDKFFSARVKEFETGFDKTMTQAQTYNPAAGAKPAPQQTPAVSGSMMLMGGGIGLAAIGSAVAFIAQSLKNVSFWNVLAVFLIILLIFGGPMIIVSLVKLYRRDIAVYLEASGLALNKRMRLNRFMSKIFTERPEIPKGSLVNSSDVIKGIFQREQERTGQAASAFRKCLNVILWVFVVAAFGIAGGILLWQYLCR